MHCTPVTVAVAGSCGPVLNRRGEVETALRGSALHARAALPVEAKASALLGRGVLTLKAGALGTAAFLGWAMPAARGAVVLCNSNLGRRTASFERVAFPNACALLIRTTLSACNICWGWRPFETEPSFVSGIKIDCSTFILVIGKGVRQDIEVLFDGAVAAAATAAGVVAGTGNALGAAPDTACLKIRCLGSVWYLIPFVQANGDRVPRQVGCVRKQSSDITLVLLSTRVIAEVGEGIF